MKIFLLVVSLIIITFLEGCSAYMVYTQPEQKDLSVLHVGTRRDAVIAELGQPFCTSKDSNGINDIYVVDQGKYGPTEKVTRTVFYCLADLFSYFIWEVVGIPIEKDAVIERMRYWVIYGLDEKIVKIGTLDSVATPTPPSFVTCQ